MTKNHHITMSLGKTADIHGNLGVCTTGTGLSTLNVIDPLTHNMGLCLGQVPQSTEPEARLKYKCFTRRDNKSQATEIGEKAWK